MSSYLDIQGQIVAKMLEIPGIGNVKAYHQRVVTKEELEAIFQIDLNLKSPIRAWLVVWESSEALRTQTQFGSYWKNHTFSVTGYLSFNSESEAKIRELAELILAKFATSLTLGLNDLTFKLTLVEDSGVRIDRFRRDMIGGVLCSAADITITAKERILGVTFE